MRHDDRQPRISAWLGAKIWHVRVLKHLLELRGNLRMDEAALQHHQDRKLRAIVSHAYRTVPFYQELLDRCHVAPDDIRGVPDLHKLPVIDKTMLRDLPLDRKTSRACRGDRIVSFVTGGSTGKPFTVYLSDRELQARVANRLRILFLHGYSIFDRTARVEGAFSSVERGHLHRLGLVRKFVVPADIPVSGQARILVQSRPEVIEGYPSRLNLIAKHLETAGIRPRRPRIILTNSETLLPAARDRIEAAFGRRVTNVYDSHEFAQMAWECREHRGLHVSADSLVIQILRNDREVEDGQEGEIVITGLNNRVMPLLRYRMGDTGVRSTRQCPCGIAFPLLEALTGRTNDVLFAPDGAEIAPQAFDKLFREHRGVLEYQVVQNCKDALDVNLVVSREYDGSADATIEQALRSRYGFTVRVNRVDHIARTGSGKLKCYVCNLPGAAGSS
jgi:phenylacetate-CoA ligase